MHRCDRKGLTLTELAVALVVIVVVLGVLLPGLFAARASSYREVCTNNQREIGAAWFAYLEENNERFPLIRLQPSWRYGGVRFTGGPNNESFVDKDRPISAMLTAMGAKPHEVASMFQCPADRGITSISLGTSAISSSTAFRSYGTSYRANPWLLNARTSGLDVRDRAVARGEIITSPSRLVLMGDPTWYEVYEQTGRKADWHGEPGECNLLFLDGSVRFRRVQPRGEPGPMTFKPQFMPSESLGFQFEPPEQYEQVDQ